MAETERNYEIGYGKPPVGRRFEKSRSGNPRGPRRRSAVVVLPTPHSSSPLSRE
jgi:hypothetical protein